MIRFRHPADEAKYNKLRGAIYRRIASSLPASAVSEVLANFSKLELLLHLEGLRQGLAIAAVTERCELGPTRASKAYQAHALVYGSSESLSDEEKGWLDRAEADGTGDPWLDDAPIRFGGTVTAGAGDEPTPSSDSTPKEPARVVDDDGTVYMERLPDNVLQALEGAEQAPTSPSFLDRVRTEVQGLVGSGKKFADWADLIMSLHMTMAVDAAYLDLQLASVEGRTVLDQCGLFELRPGAGIDLASLGIQMVVLPPQAP